LLQKYDVFNINYHCNHNIRRITTKKLQNAPTCF